VCIPSHPALSSRLELRLHQHQARNPRACRSRLGATTKRLRPGISIVSMTSSPLNTSHPEVQAEILKIMGFWIQLGVSGFRMDAVPFIIATNGSDQARIAAMLLLTLRGTPTVYYGDEIAMRDVAIAPTQVRDPLGNARLAITKEQYYGCGKGCQRDQCVCARTASPELTAIPHRRTRASKHGHGNRLGWRCRRTGRCCHQPDPLGGRRFGATGTFRHRNRWCSIA
jgi:Alpha amylase, catalytic domain